MIKTIRAFHTTLRNRLWYGIWSIDFLHGSHAVWREQWKSQFSIRKKVFSRYFVGRKALNLRQLRKTDFWFNTDSTGARYVCKATEELTKHRREDDEGFDGGLMYEKRGGPNCPVVSFELYLSHLNPLNEFLFQRPKRNASTSEDVW